MDFGGRRWAVKTEAETIVGVIRVRGGQKANIFLRSPLRTFRNREQFKLYVETLAGSRGNKREMGMSETVDTLESPHLAGFFSYRNNILQNRDWLAEDAVCILPVSGRNSLLTGK